MFGIFHISSCDSDVMHWYRRLIQVPILWHCCSQSGADGSFENGAKIQSDVDAGAVREMQPTEQIAIKINGHISNILSRPGQKFSIKDKAGFLRPYFPYFINHALKVRSPNLSFTLDVDIKTNKFNRNNIY